MARASRAVRSRRSVAEPTRPEHHAMIADDYEDIAKRLKHLEAQKRGDRLCWTCMDNGWMVGISINMLAGGMVSPEVMPCTACGNPLNKPKPDPDAPKKSMWTIP